MKRDLEILIHKAGADQVQVIVRGQIDAHSVGRLDASLNEILADRAVWVVVDLADVEYVASAGVMRLITARDQARALGGDVAVAGAKPQVLQVFEILGLDGMLRFVDDAGDAWKGFARAS